jgi:hypothetical protein
MTAISRSFLVITLLFCAAVTTSGQELNELPYVPTPEIVVEEMIKVADIGGKDFVIDLGSGDGRLVISAAKQHQATGFGVDIDRRLVALSNKNAREVGVADRVQFFERDMFQTDIGKASVLMLYVLPDFMSKLRSKVLAELQPGTRVVAHDYHMGEWHPDRMITLTVPEKIPVNGTDKAYVYLWIVPAVVNGSWRLFFDTGNKAQELTVTFAQEYQRLSATARTGKPVTVEKPEIRGDQISFGLTLGPRRYQFHGRVEGDKITGRAVAGSESVNWIATRIP